MSESPARYTIGLISDTHGLLRPEVHQALEGVRLILHAGDVGGNDILHELRIIAPVMAVHGNTDPVNDPGLPAALTVEAGGLLIHISHGHELGIPTPATLLAAYEGDVIVYGHTHRPLVTRIGDRLVVNPGAAGQRRFNFKPSVARLTIANGVAEAEIVALG